MRMSGAGVSLTKKLFAVLARVKANLPAGKYCGFLRDDIPNHKTYRQLKSTTSPLSKSPSHQWSAHSPQFSYL